MSKQIRGLGGHLHFPVNPKKNISVVEDVEILLPSRVVDFCSALSEENSKCLGKSEPGTAIFVFLSARKKTQLVYVEILLPVKFREILLSGFRGEV